MTSERNYQLRHSLYLLLTAVIWGIAFVAQSVGMEHVGPFTFNAVRFFLGAATLLPFILVRSKGRSGREAAGGAEQSLRKGNGASGRRMLLKGGLLCGTALAVASSLQQIGIQYTTVGKAGFLTAMYIVAVPILGIFAGRKAGGKVWLAVLTAVAGMYFLCLAGGELQIQKGDLYCIGCAFFFSLQIMLVDRFAPHVDGVQLSALQFLVSGTVSAAFMFLTEQPQLSQIFGAAVPILYAGVLSCGAAYTLQVIGQKGMNPTVASLIMSLESAISVIAGFLILHQTMTARELTGCALMACAIVLAQI
jgi:drug/metabolite transporter (DMT)-like permease